MSSTETLPPEPPQTDPTIIPKEQRQQYMFLAAHEIGGALKDLGTVLMSREVHMHALNSFIASRLRMAANYIEGKKP